MVTVNGDYNSCGSRQWEASRPVADQGQSEEHPEGTYAPPSTVARALREQCRIPFESFFLVTYEGKGKFTYFSGPNGISEDDIRKVFRRDKFLQCQSSTSPPRESLPQAYGHAHEYQESSLRFDDQWGPLPKRRKRPRASDRRDRDDEDRPIITSSKRALVIGDSEAVRDFYTQRFRCLQQTACKIIAKPIIRLISPKKQANNPYTKRDAAAPAWWPKPWGQGEKDKVRHVEPDHQWKTERVYLLTHIIKMLVDPQKQPPEMQRLDVNIAKIEAVAMDSLRSFFSDTSKPKNAKKKAILKEIFKVAKMEEKYMKDEIDGTTQVLVTEDDLVMDYCFDSDDVASDQEDYADVKGEPGQSEASPNVSPTRAVVLPNSLLPALPSTTGSMLALQQQQQQPTAFFHTLPIRSQYTPPPAMLPSDLGGPDPYYPETSSLSGLPSLQMHDLLTSGPHHHPQQHDASRRSSLFAATPTTDFNGGTSPSALYGGPPHHSPWETQPSSQSQHPGPSSSAATTPATTPETTAALYVYPTATATAQHHHRQYEHYQHGPAPQLPPPMLPAPMAQHHSHHHHHQQVQSNGTVGHYNTTSAVYAEQQQYHHQALFRGGNIHLAVHHQEQHQGYPPAGRGSI